MWVLVLRNTETKQSWIWQHAKLKGVMNGLRAWIHNRMRLWHPRADRHLLKYYNEVTHPYKPEAFKLFLQDLSALNCRPVTRNAVYGRYWRLTNAHQRPKPKANNEDRDAQVQRRPIAFRLLERTGRYESQASDSNRAE
jgi:hypothetical protein